MNEVTRAAVIFDRRVRFFMNQFRADGKPKFGWSLLNAVAVMALPLGILQASPQSGDVPSIVLPPYTPGQVRPVLVLGGIAAPLDTPARVPNPVVDSNRNEAPAESSQQNAAEGRANFVIVPQRRGGDSRVSQTQVQSKELSQERATQAESNVQLVPQPKNVPQPRIRGPVYDGQPRGGGPTKGLHNGALGQWQAIERRGETAEGTGNSGKPAEASEIRRRAPGEASSVLERSQARTEDRRAGTRPSGKPDNEGSSRVRVPRPENPPPPGHPPVAPPMHRPELQQRSDRDVPMQRGRRDMNMRFPPMDRSRFMMQNRGEEDDDEVELDDIMESDFFKKLLGLTEENLRLQYELKLIEAKSTMKLEHMELEARHQIERYESELNRCREELEAARAELEESEVRNAAMHEEFEQALARTRAELNETRDTASQRAEMAEALERRAAEWREQLEVRGRHLEEQEGRIRDLQQELEEARRAHEGAAKHTDAQHAEIQKLRAMEVNLAEQRMAWQRDMRSAKQELAEEKAAMVEQTRQLRERVEVLSVEKAALLKKLESIQKNPNADGMEKELDQLRAQNNELRSLVENRDRQIGELSENMAKGRNEAEHLTRALEAKAKELEAKLLATQKELANEKRQSERRKLEADAKKRKDTNKKKPEERKNRASAKKVKK